MVQVLDLGPSRGQGIAQALGMTLGNGLSNFINNYYASKSIDEVMKNPKFRNSDVAGRMSALETALRPFGETGQQILQTRMGIEKQHAETKEKKKKFANEQLTKQLIAKHQSGKKLTENELAQLDPDTQMGLYKADYDKLKNQQEQLLDQQKLAVQQGNLKVAQEKERRLQHNQNLMDALFKTIPGLPQNSENQQLTETPSTSFQLPGTNAQTQQNVSNQARQDISQQPGFDPRNIPSSTIAALSFANPTTANALASLKGNAENIAFQKFKDLRDFEMKRADPFLKEMDAISQGLPIEESALNAMEGAILSGDNDISSLGQYAVEATGFEPFRSTNAAILKTAGKDYFINTLSKAGARPNQWIEQQISQTMPNFGRTTAGNLVSLSLIKFEKDLKKERLRIGRQIEEDSLKNVGFTPGNISSLVEKEMAPFVDLKQKKLAYNIQHIKEKYDPTSTKQLDSLDPVAKGTPLTVERARQLLQEFGDNAEEVAKKLGYTIYPAEIFEEEEY